MSGQDAPTRPGPTGRMRRLGGMGAVVLTVGVVLTAVLGLAACGAGNGTGNGTGNGGGDGGERTLDVLAAASLTESFEELADVFEAGHPGVEVRLVLESSATLAGQVVEGAPADVLATADESSMDRVVDAGAVEDAEVFATNELVLVTPATNPAGVRSIADLDDPDVAYVTCVETAPCGALAARLLARNDVAADPRSLEVDVKAVLTKVVADEADAGLVYATDAVAAGDEVVSFDVPGSGDELTRYPVAVVEQADEPELAAAWVDLALSEDGQEILAAAGFGPP